MMDAPVDMDGLEAGLVIARWCLVIVLMGIFFFDMQAPIYWAILIPASTLLYHPMQSIDLARLIIHKLKKRA